MASHAHSETPSMSGAAEASSLSKPSTQAVPTCAQCGASPEALKQCTKCHSISYCTKDCQKAHYKTHKKECASLAQAYVKVHEPKMASRAPPKVGDRSTGFKKWQFDT
ncbi:hypothetical protein K458DRAFT_428576 [Lentithecium fluviatile CBS 122367]|uniref:MYND-type domain-containing protein n=1 Tax=Lentithecium fluviatile CBS 122367 TaxID=1168545 RepID=A0A6G1JBE3_9PLEO|nr:hypothetical protein K458DRAFT_428576 [Lentithecium fluviatile CBS 122367]